MKYGDLPLGSVSKKGKKRGTPWKKGAPKDVGGRIHAGNGFQGRKREERGVLIWW